MAESPTVSVTWEQAVAQVCGPGSPYEITEAEVLGHPSRLFRHAPDNLRQLFAGARAHGEATFLVYDDERWSFSKVMAHVDALGDALVNRYGVVPGDRVAIAMRNYPEWVISFAAIVSIGAISVSLNSLWTADELDYAIGDATPAVLIADIDRITRSAASCAAHGTRIIAVRGDAPAGCDAWADVVVPGPALPEVAIAPDDDATILYTSGTTGRPKGAVSTHRAVVHGVMGFASAAAVDTLRAGTPSPDAPAAEPPAFILIVPLFHVTGCVPVMMSCFVGGLKLVMMYRWDVDKALELVERERITTFIGVPTQSWDLVNSPRFAEFDTSSLRMIGGGGAPAPPALVGKVAGSFRNGAPRLGYGMTETNAYGPGHSGADYIAHPTSTGRVVSIMQLEVRDSNDVAVAPGERGEIWFNGPNLIRGYWNRPEATAETIVDGWLRSGDIGRIDSEGFVYIEDRAKDMILRGGENIYGAEVEAAIYEHPAVHEAAVFGVPDDRLGEEVGVTIHLNTGHTLDADGLRAFLAPKIAAFKIPRHVEFAAEPLPRNAAGKFLKRELRDAFVARNR
jgi:long-chain acyl-CoA synthetase